MRLYDYTSRYQQVLAMAEEAETDEEYQLIIDTLDSLQDAFDEKIEGMAKIDRELTAQEKTLREEADRLTHRARQIKKNRESLREYMLDQMQILDRKQVRGDLFTVSVRKGREVLRVFDETKVPQEYFKPQPAKLDRVGLLKDYKAGKPIEGVATQRNDTLSIR